MDQDHREALLDLLFPRGGIQRRKYPQIGRKLSSRKAQGPCKLGYQRTALNLCRGQPKEIKSLKKLTLNFARPKSQTFTVKLSVIKTL